MRPASSWKVNSSGTAALSCGSKLTWRSRGGRLLTEGVWAAIGAVGTNHSRRSEAVKQATGARACHRLKTFRLGEFMADSPRLFSLGAQGVDLAMPSFASRFPCWGGLVRP